MPLNLVVDCIVRGKIYPALARHRAEPYTPEWRQFEQHWPNTVPLRLQEYFDNHNIEYRLYSTDESYPNNSFYPIGLGFFNFDLDYFSLLPVPVFSGLIARKLRLLFYYHEGDNPQHIKQRLDRLAGFHGLAPDCYRFVSGNTAAKNLKKFAYFPDFELWYRHRNTVPPLPIHDEPRSRDFTVLNRLHKSWRATFMADLLPLLHNSYWSYCETGRIYDEENPLEIDSVTGLRNRTQDFLDRAPYYTDNLSDTERNSNAVTVEQFYTDSWMHIVVETHWDADQSSGAFLTEKTFKPIKHGQPFFIAGCAGSLQTLRDLGYRTFDSVLDNTYDDIQDNTLRWRALRRSIEQVQDHLPRVFEQCRPDIEHNQQLFLEQKTQRLNTLLERLYEQN